MASNADKSATISLGRLDSYLGFQLKRLQNELSRDFSERTSDVNLRSGSLSAMELILVNPGISQIRLSHEIGMDKSVMGLLIDDLERRGLVLRERSKQDRRLYDLSITPVGREVLEHLFEELAETERAALAALRPHELEAIGEILGKIYHAYVRDLRQVR